MSRGLFIILNLLVASLVLSACITSEPHASYGIQPEHAAFVPAATAILPCQVWPAGARFFDLPLTSATNSETTQLCAAIDAAIIKAYDNQPFMRGFSPRFVQKSLAEAGRGALLERLPQLWSHQTDSCKTCRTAPAFYGASIADRVPWLQWLTELSQAVRHADAVLLPFVTFAYEKRYQDRGLAVAERAAGIAILLVDTGSGELLWAGGREAVAPVKRLTTGSDQEPLTPVPWDEVIPRLLTEDLWREFPGRQIY